LLPRLSWSADDALDGHGEEMLPWLPHVVGSYWGGGFAIPAMEAAFCIKAASIASTTRAFRSLAF
jgi:hypothetical protein